MQGAIGPRGIDIERGKRNRSNGGKQTCHN